MRENYILAVEDLHTRISPMIMRRTKKEVLKELPSKTIINIKCEKSKRQRVMLENLQRNYGKSGGGSGGSESVSSKSKKKKEKKKETSTLVQMQYVRLLCSHPDLVTTTKTSALHGGGGGGGASKNKKKRRRGSGQGREKEKDNSCVDDVMTDQYCVRDSGKLVALLRLLAEAGIGNGPPKEEEEDDDEEEEEEEVDKVMMSKTSKKKKETNQKKTKMMMIATPKNGWLHKILIFTSYKKTLNMLENVMFHSSVSLCFF